MTFGEKLKIIRESKGITQGELATLLSRSGTEVKREDITNWEIGRHHPKWPAAVAISKYFKVSLDDFFYEEKTVLFNKLRKGFMPHNIALASLMRHP